MNQAFHHIIKISGFDSQLLLDVESGPDVLPSFYCVAGSAQQHEPAEPVKHEMGRARQAAVLKLFMRSRVVFFFFVLRVLGTLCGRCDHKV